MKWSIQSVLVPLDWGLEKAILFALENDLLHGLKIIDSRGKQGSRDPSRNIEIKKSYFRFRQEKPKNKFHTINFKNGVKVIMHA